MNGGQISKLDKPLEIRCSEDGIVASEAHRVIVLGSGSEGVRDLDLGAYLHAAVPMYSGQHLYRDMGR